REPNLAGEQKPLSEKILIRNLDFFYGKSQALKNINLTLYGKKATAIIGPSGCGKSPSRPGEFHPEPLTDSGREPLDSSGSCHRTKAPAFPLSSRSSRRRCTPANGDDVPP